MDSSSSGKFMKYKAEEDNETDPYTSVYQATTQPLNAADKCKKTKKPQRRDKSDLGENFIAPDGGWAWLVCIAAGISNVSLSTRRIIQCSHQAVFCNFKLTFTLFRS